ncbi:MAG: type VI secretion system contractile sheath large subunit [Gemmatimonadota bacterium]|jgi:type VI secretion system protein ImpC
MANEKEQAAAATEQETVEELSLLDQIVEEGRFGKAPAAQERGRGLVKQFVAEVLEGSIAVGEDTEAMLNARIAQIDHLVSAQLNEVMHAEELQRLEATWRGLHYLLAQSETGEMLRIKVLNVPKKELLRDLTKGAAAIEFDQSQLFKKVYEEEFGVLGGAPFGALIGDYYFGRSGQDIELLDKISKVSAAAHAPFLTAASSDMFNLESFADLAAPRDMAKVFDTTEYAKWKQFRDSEDSRYVALTMPHILLREPYGRDTVPIEAFDYEEAVDGKDHDKYLWGNAAWALGARVTQAFAQHGWCATIRGVESGGLVQGLPVHNFRTDSGEVVMKCPTETPITDRREKELADLGFAPLIHRKNTADAAFLSVQSAQKPKVYNKPEATASARISAQLPYIFSASRFAHYLKSMMRDKIGGFMSRSEAASFLNDWIADYVVANPDASATVKAKRPLSEARIDVTEIPGKPGAYRAVAFLKPHFQLDELGVSLRLVADLPPPAQ